MTPLALHRLHEKWGGVFDGVADHEVVTHYGDVAQEYRALRASAALLDLGFRTRLSVLGADRERFLNGQVTNDLKRLRLGHGCYAAIVNARGKMDSDANIYRLADEFLLDAEAGMAPTLLDRLSRYIVADDVSIQDVAPHFGMLSVQGPQASKALAEAGIGIEPLLEPLSLEFGIVPVTHPEWGQLFVANQPRSGTRGYDLFVPGNSLELVAFALQAAVVKFGGRTAGWHALETCRIEAGIPRFGADMDATNLPPEAGLETRAISYSKGCYIGQEIIARIRTYGQVARTLRGLKLAGPLPRLPDRGTGLFKDGQQVGAVTSATHSIALGIPIALAYVRKECNQPGTLLTLRGSGIESNAEIVTLPFA